MKIVQLTDTHISSRGGATTDNLEKFVELINQIDPVFVVHTGDVAILDPDNDQDRRAADKILQGINAPLRVLPGNHDVGEGMGNAWAGIVTTPERLVGFQAVFGEDRWLEIVGEWALIGFNSEIMGSGMAEETAQWEWLETLPAQIGNRPTLVFCHKPVWNPYEEESLEHNIAIPTAARDRLLEVLADVDVKGFGSGHLHHFALNTRPTAKGEATTITAPATGFAGDPENVPGRGVAQQGIVEYALDGRDLTALFRNLANLAEGPAIDIPEFQAALDDLGVTI
ncbi:MAG: metallophosphoesterase family protein [Cumulibacter sp.]